jgi:lipoyl(octanoyl) transferase
VGSRTLCVRTLGRVEYDDAVALQRAYVAARKADAAPDTLFLVEHPPVITMGRGAKDGNLLAPCETLQARGLALHESDRGGDVTYHGPRQIVGYPIVSLAPDRCDVRRYVRDLEETMIRAVGDYGLEAHRIPGWTGIWLGDTASHDARKIGAIGVHISRWVTSHGFALNVDPDLSHFELIVPCGIREAGVTSMARELGVAPQVADVEKSLARHLAALLDAEIVFLGVDHLSISATVVREDGAVLLLKRRDDRGGYWQPVTGRVEPGESPMQAAERELFEETGLEAAVEPLGYVHAFGLGEETGTAPPLYEEEAFAAVSSAGARVHLDPAEHSEFAWATPDEAERRVPWPGLRRAIRLAVQRGEQHARVGRAPLSPP